MAVDLTTDCCGLGSGEYPCTDEIERDSQDQAGEIANLAGFTPEEATSPAAKAEAAGAGMIEISTHCPHVGEILSAIFPGMNFPARQARRSGADEAIGMVSLTPQKKVAALVLKTPQPKGKGDSHE